MVMCNGMHNYCPGRVLLKDREAVLKVCSGPQVLAPCVPTYYSTMRRWPIMIALGGECFNVTKTKSTLQSLAVHIPAFLLHRYCIHWHVYSIYVRTLTT